MYSTDKFSLFSNHYVRSHKHDPKFYVACCIGSCCYTTRSWPCYRVHVHRKHQDVENMRMPAASVNNFTNGLDNSAHDDLDADTGTSHSLDVANFNAMFTLSLAAKHNMSQSAVDSVVSTTSALIENHLTVFKQRVKRKLNDMNVDADVVDEIPIETHLTEFESHCKRQTFYRKHVSTFVEPEPFVLGRKLIHKSGKIFSVRRIGYIIPFEKSLQNLLSMPEVWNHVNHRHNSVDQFMWDICDGDAMQSDSDALSLQIVINCDDLEIVNPLGSHTKKHKLSVFYFTLANIPPQYRSKADVIQLLAIAKTQDLREHRADSSLLSDFCQTMQRLSTEGVKVNVHGDVQNIKGNLVMVCADTLASNWLGKFKEGVAFAMHNCRQCEVGKDSIKTKLVERDVILRSTAEHKERCDTLKELSPEARIYWSKMWGINGTSCLLQISGFDLVNGLVQDPMHIILEGVLQLELKLLLHSLIYVKKLFSLKWLNYALGAFRYSYLHCKSKPEVIEKHHLSSSGTIKQTASSMLTIVHTLPFVIGHLVPENDANWLNALRLFQVVLFATSSYCARETAVFLQILIAEYLHNFQQLYPDAPFIPKMHFMTHLPSQMIKYGPLRHHWCMRFEAKNGFFANKKYKNFVNLPRTLAFRHQLYMAYAQSGSATGRSECFLYAGDCLESGIEASFSSKYPSIVSQLANYSNCDSDAVYIASGVSVHGLHYRCGCVVVIEYDSNDEPVFGLLRDVIVVDHVKYFVLDKLVTTYCLHILSYIIQATSGQVLLRVCDLKFSWPLSVYLFKGQRAVMNVNTHTYAFPF